jgi:hypothetical protein
MDAALLKQIMELGGPWGVIAVLLFIMIRRDARENKTQDAIYQAVTQMQTALSAAVVVASSATTAEVVHNRELLITAMKDLKDCIVAQGVDLRERLHKT